MPAVRAVDSLYFALSAYAERRVVPAMRRNEQDYPRTRGEKLLRRMTGSVTEYMDAAGLADRLNEHDRALLTQHDGEPEATPVMGGMQL